MNKKSYFKGFVTGVLVILLATNIVFAATSNANIKVTFDKIRMVFDGVEKTPNAGSKPITYNGKIYVPLDFVAKSMGKNYTWDSKNKIAYVGVKGIVATTSDGHAQLTFPLGWEKDTTDDGISLNYSDGNSGFVVIVRQDKNLFSNVTINDYCLLVSNQMASRMKNSVTTEPCTIKINNYPAQQFEITGEVKKDKLKCLCTMIETTDSYYQLIAYTSQDTYDKDKSNFVKISNTFKEVYK